ncbi:MAG TPA: IPTL-CTERM sorting domain-containing protein, partial [Thermoanaerobaculia bacterium]|nr:IPTL-CTERM sorting domain-containing protein [Thermoanaerobaculia bacterium]
HGSHVSGTAAGFGVTSAGATFAGPYDANTSTYTPLRIEPGTAPMAKLYGIRVFGCAGSTGLTVAGIDWAMDPNGDNDVSDHLDVINMSLGSSFGSVLNSSSIASDNAALAGVIVVTSAGNSGDTFFISGSPGAASRAIATAASVDGGEPAPTVVVNAPAGIAGSYLAGGASFGQVLTASGIPPGPHNVVIALDPADGAGPLTTDGCSPLTNAAAIAGNIALIDRGTCAFTIKVKNAQDAGAVGVIIADNAPGSPPASMSGTDATITIPAVRVTLVDGSSFKSNIASLNVTLTAPNGGDTVASFSSRGPRRIFGSPLRLKPDIAAPGLNITSVQTGHTCMVQTGCTGLADPSGFQAGNQILIISGTSMASPHMAGIMALLRQIHPDWSVEELKALAMNYAVNDTTLFPNATPPRFGLARIGAGRVDPSKSAAGSVIAMNAEDAGLVTVTFDPEVVGTVTQTKKVRVVNKGTTAQTFDLGFDTIVDSPGVSFSLPGGNSVIVAAGETVELDVQMTADSSQMDHTRDASLFPTQGVQTNYGDQPRNFLTEEGAYLTFSQSSTLKFRLPVYMAEKPSSMMAGPATIVTGGAPTGSTAIPLSGIDVCTGTLGAGPTCTGTFPNDVESLVSPFELQVVSPLDPVNSTDYADIHYAGIAYFQAGASPSLTNDLVMFGVASWGNWSSPTDVAYNICIDNNNDGVYDRALINTNPSVFVSGAQPNDNFVRVVQNLGTGGFSILGLASYVNLVSPSVIDTGLHLNNVMTLAATPSQLGYASTTVTTIGYKIVTCPGSNLACARSATGDRCTPAPGTFYDQAAGPYIWSWAAQGLNFGGDFLDEDLNGKTLPVTWSTANLTANGSLGALLIHHHNATGLRAEAIPLDTAQRADLALTKTVDNAAPALGTNVTFTITVTNNGPNNATGVVVNDFLPDGLNYVSDDGGGAYVPGTGLWTVGALANAASATLHVTATVIDTGAIDNVASIAAVTPLDPNPANDTAQSSLLSPRSADLHMTFGANVATVNPGGSIVYTLTVTNLGQDPAYSVDVQEDFPAFPALNPASFTASQGVYNPATGHWDLASLAAGNTATLSFTVTAPNFAGALTNNASTSSAKVASRAADPNPADNSASVTVQVLSPATVTATKSVAGSFVEGGAVTYTIVLTNSGAFDQQNNTGPELTDVLPSQLTLVGASATAGTATASVGTNTVTWDGVVPAGGSVTVTVNATIKAGTALQTVTNQAGVNYDADGNGVNEAAAISDNPATQPAGDATSFVVVSPSSVGTHTKTVAGSFQEGGMVTYTVTVSNPSATAQLDNPGDEFTDVLPASLTLVSAAASSGTAVADVPTRTVHWNGTIAANGGSVTISITATVNTGTAGSTISNQGTVFFDADGNGTNESSVLTDNPATTAPDDPTPFAVAAVAAVPTLSELGLALLALLLASGALVMMRRRRA